jgi:N-acetylmuramoyl-L-alanine amidase
MRWFLAGLLVGCSCTTVCLAATPGSPADPAHRLGDEIVVCGKYFHTGTRVVLWSDPHGYDATNLAPPPVTRPSEDAAASGVRLVRGPQVTLDELRRNVDQFVIHFDACGHSRECFRVLKRRGLSVHFMCDLDGTIYQTLDLRETTWHATIANTRSVGVEVANLGAFPAEHAMPPAWVEWYQFHGAITAISIPHKFGDGGILTPHFVGRPSRPEPVTGWIQGKQVRQFDFTPHQYAALANVSATLCTVLPKIQPDYPRQRARLGAPVFGPAATQPSPGDPATQPSALADPDEPGALIPHVLAPEQFDAYQGLLGHYHVQLNKDDPGPAFQWPQFIARVKGLMTPEARRANVQWRHQPVGAPESIGRAATTAPATQEAGE